MVQEDFLAKKIILFLKWLGFGQFTVQLYKCQRAVKE